MNRYNLLVLLFCMGSLVFSQDRPEREHRIRKSQFPPVHTNMALTGKKMRNLRYYRERDSAETTYSLKFKMDKLRYHLNYDPEGSLKNAGFQVKEIDIPSETLAHITTYVDRHFESARIKRIFQEYPVDPQNREQASHTLKSTFQNLLLPENTYKILLRGSQAGLKKDYELWFDAEGGLVRMRPALPANYDRILY